MSRSITTNSLDTLEDRIQKPGYLLFLTLVLLLLIVGLVDIIDFVHEDDPILFGRYDVKYFVMMVVYTILTLAWISLLRKPNDDRLLTGILDAVQSRPTLAVSVLVLLALVFFTTLVVAEILEGLVSTLPAFQVTVLTLTLLSFGMVLFYKFGDTSRPQRWRKIVVVVLVVLLLIELLLQLLTVLGAFPVDLSAPDSIEDYAAYNRIYQSEEGFGHGLTNSFGWYAPDFELLPGSHRIVILGDSFVQGYQVGKEQGFGARLEEHLAADDSIEQTHEVLPLGHPDRGPGLYLSEWLLSVMLEAFEPDEAIVFFDMGNDFQTVDRAGTGYPYFVVDEAGRAALDRTRYWYDLHKAEHHVFRGYVGFQPGLILGSNYLTYRLIYDNAARVLGSTNNAEGAEPASTEYEIALENGFVFNPQTNDKALDIAAWHIKVAQEQLAPAGVVVKLVTNPVFSDAFFRQETWNTQFGNSDLLLPESQLREAAAENSIAFLGLGSYMEAQGLSPADVQTLYFDQGRGHYTPAGHEFVAEAIYQCFYAQTLTPEYGCDLR